MQWFNFYGLIFVAVILVPNLIFALKCKNGFLNSWHNKAVESAEQIGRFGCFGFMIFNIPYTYWGFAGPKVFCALPHFNLLPKRQISGLKAVFCCPRGQ